MSTKTTRIERIETELIFRKMNLAVNQTGKEFVFFNKAVRSYNNKAAIKKWIKKYANSVISIRRNKTIYIVNQFNAATNNFETNIWSIPIHYLFEFSDKFILIFKP